MKIKKAQNSLTIISLYLNSPLSSDETPENLSLLATDIESFYTNIELIASAISKCLAIWINDLRIIANISNTDNKTGTSSPYGHEEHESAEKPQHPLRIAVRARHRRKTQSNTVTTTSTTSTTSTIISSQLNDRLHALHSVQVSELPTARREMAEMAARLIQTQSQVIEQVVILLERSKYGTLGRATKAKAEHLATVAEGVEGKLKYVIIQLISSFIEWFFFFFFFFPKNKKSFWKKQGWLISYVIISSLLKLQIAATMYTPETVSALSKYRQHLHHVQEQLQETIKREIQELRVFGDKYNSTIGLENDDDGDGGYGNDFVQRYEALIGDIESIKTEIGKLEK